MRPHPYLVTGFKYATLTLLIVSGVIVGAAIFRQTKGPSLTGRLVPPQQSGVIPTMRFEADRAVDGFSLPADTHVIFSVPEGLTRITRITFFGGPDTDKQRYWGYCYSGREASNKANGKTGRDLYDGQFFYSIGEREAQGNRPAPADNDILGIFRSTKQAAPEVDASVAEIFRGGDTCYVMSDTILPAAIDSDNDDLNNMRERMIGTNPNDPDTDRDGIPDGREVFVTKTNPLDPDTEHDGLTDGCEDGNQNGKMDKGETSALNPDSDRDGLCDGNGLAGGCPEARKKVCRTASGADGLVCRMELSIPVYGEDMNQNCKVDKKVDQDETDPTNPETFGIPDWEYKWRKLSNKSDYIPGTPAPEFPIPNIPSRH